MKIIKVKKNNDGDITNVMTDDRKIISLSKAVALAKDGEIDSVIVDKNRNGVEVIKSSTKSSEECSLDNLPIF